MQVQDEDFDAQPELLNTPSWVVNLETGQLLPHAPEYLMKWVTRCDPNMDAMIPWDQMDNEAMVEAHLQKWAPRFLFTLRNCTGVNHPDGHQGWGAPAIGCIYGYILIGEIRHHALFFIIGEPGIGKTQLWQVIFKIIGSYSGKIRHASISKSADAGLKRFDKSEMVGKRMLWVDETMISMTFDEAWMSDMASGEEMQVEHKFGRTATVKNVGKICISGNHPPHFTSGKAGGLVSRMMLANAKGENLRGKKGVEVVNVAKKIAEEEGPALLTWAIQNAIYDHTPGGHERFSRLLEPMKQASSKYAADDSSIVQWVKDDLELDPTFDIDLKDAYAGFKTYTQGNNEFSRLRSSDFLRLLLIEFPELGRGERTDKKRLHRVYIRGLGFRRAYDDAGNEMKFPP